MAKRSNAGLTDVVNTYTTVMPRRYWQTQC